MSAATASTSVTRPRGASATNTALTASEATFWRQRGDDVLAHHTGGLPRAGDGVGQARRGPPPDLSELTTSFVGFPVGPTPRRPSHVAPPQSDRLAGGGEAQPRVGTVDASVDEGVATERRHPGEALALIARAEEMRS